MESIAFEVQTERGPGKAPMSNLMNGLGGRVESRVLHTVHRGGWVLQRHANAMVCRAAQTVRRSTITMLVTFLGAALLVASWIIVNVALHSWLVTFRSGAMSNLVVAGVNLLVGAVTLVAAAYMTAVPPLPWLLPRRRRTMRRRVARVRTSATEGTPPPLQVVYAQPALNAQEDSLQNALGATLELGIQAMRTIPQLVRALRQR